MSHTAVNRTVWDLLKLWFLAIGLSIVFGLYSIAVAQTAPRTVDFTVILLNEDNDPIVECSVQSVSLFDCPAASKRELTLGMVARRALLSPEQGIKEDEAQDRWQLALNVYQSKAAELSEKDVVLIKKRILAVYPSPLIVGRAFSLIRSK